MSVEKNMNTRIQHKHDTEANWNKAINFIPRIGEIIVYDIDENHNYSRLKIGDGIRTINNLEFSQTDKTEMVEVVNDIVREEILTDEGIIRQDVLPEGFPYVSKGVVVPESIITVDRTLYDAPCGPIMDQFTLAAGDSYTVNYNGVEYQCIAKTIIVQNAELVTIGNSGPIDGSEPTNEPFLIVDVPESMVAGFGCQGIAAILDGSSQIILSITGNTIQKISKELLPNIGVSNIVDGIGIASARSVAANPELGDSSFAFGSNAKASGHFSHAEGNNTVASGQTSHAEGDSTTASSNAQHVQGKYNIEDTNNQYAHIVGNGSSDSARSNAHTLDWNGNAWFQGDIYVGGEGMNNGSKLVTESTFNEIANNAYDQLQQLKNLSQSAANATLSSSLTWDGNIGDKEFIVNNENDTSKLILVRVCDEVPVDYLDNPVFVTIIGEDGMIFTYQCQWVSLNDIHVAVDEVSGLQALFVLDSDQDQYAKKGIYFSYQEEFVDDQWKTVGYVAAANFYGNSFAKESVINALGYVPVTEEFVNNSVSPFSIEITTEDMVSGTSNRATSEISAAVASGKQLQLILNGDPFNVPLIGVDDESAIFAITSAVEGGVESYAFIIYEDKTAFIMNQYLQSLPADGIKGQFLSVNDEGRAIWVDKPTYTASDVGALPNTTNIPTKVSQLENDKDYLTRIVLRTNEYTPLEASNILTNPSYDGFIIHTDDIYGELWFSNYSMLKSSMCAECILTSDYNGSLMLFRLIGDLVQNTWSLKVENIGLLDSHGTHVTYSTTAPVMDGTASVGDASTVARSDHRHPTDTSRAAQTDLTSHISSTSVHITPVDRTNLNAVPKKPGEIVAGKEYTINNETVIAKAYAEVFNFLNTATGEASHAEGYKTTASGNRSHAEGDSTTASGYASHAEGGSTNKAFDFITEKSTDEEIITAWNNNKFTLASSIGAHAEGYNTLALDAYSHAEGHNTIASGYASHAEGDSTTASSNAQHVQGKYNIEDTNNQYAHIVGNGSSKSARSNAHTLDWNGNAWFAGDVYVGSTSGTNKDEGSKKLATIDDIQAYIDSAILGGAW